MRSIFFVALYLVAACSAPLLAEAADWQKRVTFTNPGAHKDYKKVVVTFKDPIRFAENAYPTAKDPLDVSSDPAWVTVTFIDVTNEDLKFDLLNIGENAPCWLTAQWFYDDTNFDPGQ